MPARIVVIAEAEADRRIVCDLIDRKIKYHAPDWFDVDHLDAYREWCGLEPGEQFTPWKILKKVDDSQYRRTPQVRALGFSGFTVNGYDGASARKALIRCALAKPRPDAVVLIRDMDDQAAMRRPSIEAQRDRIASNSNLIVILAMPNAKREAWVLNGFVARAPEEISRLAALKSALGFDPCLRAEKLTSTSGLQKDPKRVVEILLGGDSDREEACWSETDWNTLRERGTKTGLKDFLSEVQSRLLPIIIG